MNYGGEDRLFSPGISTEQMNQTGYGKMNYEMLPDLAIGVNLIRLDD